MVGVRVCVCLCDGSGQLLYMKALQILHLLGTEIKYYISLGCAETVLSVGYKEGQKKTR